MKKIEEIKKTKPKKFWKNLGFFAGVLSLAGFFLVSVAICVDVSGVSQNWAALCYVGSIWAAATSTFLAITNR